MGRVTGKAKKYVLVVKPILHGSGICSGPAFNICDTVRMNMAPGEDKRRQSTYPLLLPLTLCSENVMSLWSMDTPTPMATFRKSSSVVHYTKTISSIYAPQKPC